MKLALLCVVSHLQFLLSFPGLLKVYWKAKVIWFHHHQPFHLKFLIIPFFCCCFFLTLGLSVSPFVSVQVLRDVEGRVYLPRTLITKIRTYRDSYNEEIMVFRNQLVPHTALLIIVRFGLSLLLLFLTIFFVLILSSSCFYFLSSLSLLLAFLFFWYQ